jgi:hypothetical protein
VSLLESPTIPVGVCVFQAPPKNHARTVAYGAYLHEVLQHAGLCYADIDESSLPDVLPRVRVLVTVGNAALPEATQSALRDWVDAGGAWLAIGGDAELPDVLGVERIAPEYQGWGTSLNTLGEGYLRPVVDHPVMDHLRVPLHFFNGLPVRATDGAVLAEVLDAHQGETDRAACVEHTYGRGRTLFVAADVTGALVRIQQGVAITRDGVPSDDGISPSCDDVLKADDGRTLDWVFDRQELDGFPGYRAFFEPIADHWRELTLRAIFHLARAKDVALPLLWLYPRDLPLLGHISHDTDGNTVEHAEGLLAAMAEAAIPSTWCTILPGYAPDLIDRIKADGHELATHYNAIDEEWSEAEFDKQWRGLIDVFGGERPVTNKNHYLRWEGDTDLWEWCAERGLTIDQTKGPSKTGQAGFIFGTCHPYFPIKFRGQMIDVLELPTLTQDLVIFAPPEIADPIVDAAARCHGVAHFLFHPAHILKPGVKDSLLRTVQLVQDAGGEWWTSAAINTWERARRKATWMGCSDIGDASATLNIAEPLPDARVLWLAPEEETDTVMRWGFSFTSVALAGDIGTVNVQAP